MHVDKLFHDLSFLLAHKLSILKLNSFVLLGILHDCLATCIIVCILQLLCLLHNLASQKLVSRGNASHTSNTLSQNPCHLSPPYLPIMWYFLPFQVNTSCATFKLFKSYYLFCAPVLAHEEVLDALLSLLCLFGFTTLTSMHNVLVPNIAKRAGKRVPSPLNIK